MAVLELKKSNEIEEQRDMSKGIEKGSVELKNEEKIREPHKNPRIGKTRLK